MTGCNTNISNTVEGVSEREIEACKLIKEFSIHRGTISDFSDLICDEFVESKKDNSILVFVKHKDSPDYNRNIISVFLEDKWLFITTDTSETFRAFKKDRDNFKEVEFEEALNYLKLQQQ